MSLFQVTDICHVCTSEKLTMKNEVKEDSFNHVGSCEEDHSDMASFIIGMRPSTARCNLFDYRIKRKRLRSMINGGCVGTRKS